MIEYFTQKGMLPEMQPEILTACIRKAEELFNN